jgi:hypothetical protein
MIYITFEDDLGLHAREIADHETPQ